MAELTVRTGEAWPQADGWLAILGCQERPDRKFPVPFSGGLRPIRRYARQERQPARHMMASRPGNMPPKSVRRYISLASARLHRRPGRGRRRYLGAGATTPVLSGVLAPSPGSVRRRPKRSPIEPESINRLARVGCMQAGSRGVFRTRWARTRPPACRQATRRGIGSGVGRARSGEVGPVLELRRETCGRQPREALAPRATRLTPASH